MIPQIQMVCDSTYRLVKCHRSRGKNGTRKHEAFSKPESHAFGKIEEIRVENFTVKKMSWLLRSSLTCELSLHLNP